MPQAILTKYLPATKTRGARIKASCDRGSLTVPFNYPAKDVHAHAASELLAKFAAEDAKQYGGAPAAHHWGAFVSGGLPDGTCAHVLTSSPATPKP